MLFIRHFYFLATTLHGSSSCLPLPSPSECTLYRVQSTRDSPSHHHPMCCFMSRCDLFVRFPFIREPKEMTTESPHFSPRDDGAALPRRCCRAASSSRVAGEAASVSQRHRYETKLDSLGRGEQEGRLGAMAYQGSTTNLPCWLPPPLSLALTIAHYRSYGENDRYLLRANISLGGEKRGPGAWT